MLVIENNQIEDLKTYTVTRTVYEQTFETTVLAENESDASSLSRDEMSKLQRESEMTLDWTEYVEGLHHEFI